MGQLRQEAELAAILLRYPNEVLAHLRARAGKVTEGSDSLRIPKSKWAIEGRTQGATTKRSTEDEQELSDAVRNTTFKDQMLETCDMAASKSMKVGFEKARKPAPSMHEQPRAARQSRRTQAGEKTYL